MTQHERLEELKDWVHECGLEARTLRLSHDVLAGLHQEVLLGHYESMRLSHDGETEYVRGLPVVMVQGVNVMEIGTDDPKQATLDLGVPL